MRLSFAGTGGVETGMEEGGWKIKSAGMMGWMDVIFVPV